MIRIQKIIVLAVDNGGRNHEYGGGSVEEPPRPNISCVVQRARIIPPTWQIRNFYFAGWKVIGNLYLDGDAINRQLGTVRKHLERTERQALAAINNCSALVVPASTIQLGPLSVICRISTAADSVRDQPVTKYRAPFVRGRPLHVVHPHA